MGRSDGGINRPRGRGTAMLIAVNLSSNAYPTDVLPPLRPPDGLGGKEIQFPPLYKGRARVG